MDLMRVSARVPEHTLMISYRVLETRHIGETKMECGCRLDNGQVHKGEYSQTNTNTNTHTHTHTHIHTHNPTTMTHPDNSPNYLTLFQPSHSAMSARLPGLWKKLTDRF